MNDYLTVTKVNDYIKGIIDGDEFLSNILIKGEISNFKIHSRGHCYFTLKDENSRINAVMFSFNASKLTFTPKDGDSVLIKGKINVYSPNGGYQIYASEMSLDGLGELYVKFEELKERLSKEGLFDTDKKKKIPKFPKKIGIVTASTGAAIKDIITTINRRYPVAEVILFPSLVQGTGAKEDIVRCIKQAENTDIDTLIVGRGGGSIEDLWAFNEEIVARAIYNCSKPVISAVGHEIDYTISDFVADLRAPTPTAAAELAVPNKTDVINGLNNLKIRITESVKSNLLNLKTNIDKYNKNYLLNNPITMYEIKEQKLDNLIDKLNTNMKVNINNINRRFTLNLSKLELLNPISVLNKGYSITSSNEKTIKSIKNVKTGDSIKTKLSDGIIISEVKNIERN